jgi:hypothetical protein
MPLCTQSTTAPLRITRMRVTRATSDAVAEFLAAVASKIPDKCPRFVSHVSRLMHQTITPVQFMLGINTHCVGSSFALSPIVREFQHFCRTPGAYEDVRRRLVACNPQYLAIPGIPVV